MRLVYAFDEQAPGGRELLGGKGVGLAEMTALGIPVPAGFTVTTDACRETMRTGEVPEPLWPEVDEHVERLQDLRPELSGLGDDGADGLLVHALQHTALDELVQPSRRLERVHDVVHWSLVGHSLPLLFLALALDV